MISLATTDQLLAAIERARRIDLCAYILRPGRVLRALEDACRRGAHVTVRLEAAPYGPGAAFLAKSNARVARELAWCGADARTVSDGDAHHARALHGKVAVVDGTAFLDDRNWCDNGDTIARDTAEADVAALRAAANADVSPAARPNLWTTKGAATGAEIALLKSARTADRVDVQTETFNNAHAAIAALEGLARSGIGVRLLVSRHSMRPKERSTLDELEAAGVRVRIGDANEKSAIAGKRAWLGSGNLSAGNDNEMDWGLRTANRAVVGELERRFEERWSAAKPLPVRTECAGQ